MAHAGVFALEQVALRRFGRILGRSAQVATAEAFNQARENA
jgi:hypothetical protein